MFQEGFQLQQVSYIHYFVQFNIFYVKEFINSSSQANMIQPSFGNELSLHICNLIVDVQKINASQIGIYVMVIVLFQADNKDRKFRFFEEIFLQAEISINITFKMLFLVLNNVELNFNNRVLRWRSYIAIIAFPTTRQVELIRKKEFTTASLYPKDNTFVFYVAFFAISYTNKVHLFR